MTEQKLGSGVLAQLSLAAAFVLTAWNWFLEPARAKSWAIMLAVVAAMAVILWLARRRATPAAFAGAAQSITTAIVFAGLMLALPLTARLVRALGGAPDADLSKRGVMIVTGVFLASMGNAIPRQLTPLASLRCDPAKVQAFQRFSGWLWVLTGLAFAIEWAVLPIAFAHPVAMTTVAAAMVIIVARLATLRWAAPKQGGTL